MTPWEELLWDRLRAKKLGYHFRRQHPISNYTLDFYCERAKLCVEVDGEGHQALRDERRDAYLAELRILTVGLTNIRVGSDMEGCLDELRSVIQSRVP